jgi:hypothetical protein
MDDRAWTNIEFSGVISEEQGLELVDQLEGQGCQNGTHGSGEVSLAALSNGDSFDDEEANYGDMDGVEAWCKANRVSYLKSWEAGGGYGPGMTLYDAATETGTTCASLEGSPAMTVAEVVRLKLEDRLDERIAELRKFESFSSHYPELKVLAVEDWTDELCHFMAKRAMLAA